MNRSMMPKQVMAYNQGGIASFIPQQAQIMGQPHRLAYVNPQEEQMMLNQGGAGTPGPGGIPAYWTLTEPSTWGDGAGYEGMGNFNASDNIGTGGNSASDEASDRRAQEARMAARAAANNAYQAPEGSASSGTNEVENAAPGILDSILMGTGLKRKTAGYDAATAKTLANQQVQGLYNPTANDDNVQSGGSAPGVVTDGTVTDGTVTDGTVTDDGEPQYTYMPPFYGGYQASTAADTLVPSGGAGIASFVPPRPPIQPVQQTLNTNEPTPLPQVGGLLPVEAPVFSGGFNSMEELMAYQNQNPTANLMGEFQRLKALQGGNTTVAGVGNIFGNEPAQPYMYQGIMG